MYIEVGSGYRRILFYNKEKRHDVDVMLSRIAETYTTMHAAGYYPCIEREERSCKLIFTSETVVGAFLGINITSLPCGIYTDEQAYHKQLAWILSTATGFDTYQTIRSDADLEIGIGDMDAGSQGYVMLRDAILDFARKL